MLNGSLPKYQEIASRIKQSIAAGELPAGRPLATERELSAYFGVSRICLRQAFSTLFDQGILHRGSGGRVYPLAEKVTKIQARNIALVTTVPFSRVIEAESSEFGNSIATVVNYIEENHYSFTYIYIGGGKQMDAFPQELSAIPFCGGIYLPGNGQIDPHVMLAFKTSGKAVVVLNASDAPSEPGFHTVNIDNCLGGYKATRHLLEAEGRRVVMMNFSDGYSWQEERLQGYYQALMENGDLSSAEVVSCGTMFGSESVFEMLPKLTSIFDQHLLSSSLSVFAVSDPLATAICLWAKANGLRIPEDIALMGFGDVSCAREYNLSTVSHMSTEVGQQAAQILFDLIPVSQENAQRKLQKKIAPKLVLRNSTIKA